MKREEEILKEFGKFLITEIYDNPIYVCNFSLNKDVERHDQNKDYLDFFKSLNSEQVKLYKKVSREIMKHVLFQFLNYFENSENYKLIYEESDTSINLKDLSDYLPGLVLFDDDGWINEFSEYNNENGD